MTKEQVEGLRRFDREAAPPPWEARACSVVTPRPGFDMDQLPRPEEADIIAAARNALPRLLDEREELLAVAKEALSYVEAMPLAGQLFQRLTLPDALMAAIKKAEGP